MVISAMCKMQRLHPVSAQNPGIASAPLVGRPAMPLQLAGIL
jgi:hypothetical protein